MKVVMKYLNFLIKESKIELDPEFIEQILNINNDSDSTDIKNISNRLMGINNKDVESRRLNKSIYNIKPSSSNDMININNNDMKIGRFLSVIFPDLTDKEKEGYVNVYKSYNDEYSNFDKFKIVKGDDIIDWYDCNNYNSDKGTLGSSCMRYADSEQLELYTENKEVCSLLILVNDENLLIGRSLIWKTTDNNIVMDRIYTEKDSDEHRFKNYARKNKWYYRATQAATNKYLSSPNGNRVNDYSPEVKINNINYIKFPYLDTFAYMNTSKHLLSNSFKKWENSEDSVILLQDESGGFDQVINLHNYAKEKIEIFLSNSDWIDLIQTIGYMIGYEFIIDSSIDKSKFIDMFTKYYSESMVDNLDIYVSTGDLPGFIIQELYYKESDIIKIYNFIFNSPYKVYDLKKLLKETSSDREIEQISIFILTEEEDRDKIIEYLFEKFSEKEIIEFLVKNRMYSFKVVNFDELLDYIEIDNIDIFVKNLSKYLKIDIYNNLIKYTISKLIKSNSFQHYQPSTVKDPSDIMSDLLDFGWDEMFEFVEEYLSIDILSKNIEYKNIITVFEYI